ncbi:MAG: cytochrome c3 family protein [Deltaproteobacteria bacterium]|nr:cytochrome c3 family protein [Deltaproteobacteria bacterium]
MKNHVLRPLWVAIGIITLFLLYRHAAVPDDFGVNGVNFTYGFHRAGSIDDWKAIPVKYRGKAYCEDCHADQHEENMASRHQIIECENCHGPALDHPENPEKLALDKSRALCLRCHSELAFPAGAARSDIPGIDPEEHNGGSECCACHNPHNPSLEEMS